MILIKRNLQQWLANRRIILEERQTLLLGK